MIAILDYAAGNLTSVAHAVRHLGFDPIITDDPDAVRAADRIIFPGVGAARSAMENLASRGLDEALRDVVRAGRPTLGICIGCQVIFEQSEEDGGTSCLGLLRGRVERFRFAPGVRRKIPQIGWNEVTFRREHPVLRNIPNGSQFYFVHSYHARPDDPGDVIATGVYGDVEFTAAVAHENLFAVQFHTEKSGPVGLRLLDSFLRWTP